MIFTKLTFGDWEFLVDVEKTFQVTKKNASDHCLCAYCKNYYDTVDIAYPGLRDALKTFGIHVDGPSEIMPFEPTCVLACYRVQGSIRRWGVDQLQAAGVSLSFESSDENSFLVWVGEMILPWIQDEDEKEVISPANAEDFMERMKEVWELRHGQNILTS